MAYNEWLDMEVLEDYLDGKLDAKMMHKVERISLEDPFVAEALAGLSQSPKRSQSLSLLQKQLRERVLQKPEEKKRWTITSHRLSIAATAAVLFVTVSLLFYMRESNRREALAKQNRNIAVAVAPQTATTKPAVPKPPIAKIEAEIDKALSNASKNAYIKNNSTKVITDKLGNVDKKATLTATAIELPQNSKQESKVAADKTAMMSQIALSEEFTLARRAPESKSNIQSLVAKSKEVTFIPNTFTGRVVSKYDGLPIPGADIKLVNTDIRTKTNAKGEFSISKDSIDNYNLAVNSIGYATKEMKISSNQFSIALEPSQNSLNEVTVIEANTPIGGWNDYNLYLKNNNRLTKKGFVGKEVELNFSINKDGVPIDIKVLANKDEPSIEISNEAVRLLKEGPKWVYKVSGNNKANLKIRF